MSIISHFYRAEKCPTGTEVHCVRWVNEPETQRVRFMTVQLLRDGAGEAQSASICISLPLHPDAAMSAVDGFIGWRICQSDIFDYLLSLAEQFKNKYQP
jgi:hypothetical protein